MGSRRFELSPPMLGALLCAALAVAVVALAGCGGGGSSSDGGSTGGSGEVSTAAIELPAEIDGYGEMVKQIEAKKPSAKTLSEQTKSQEETAEMTAAAYTKAYGGAAAAYRQYAEAELLKMPYVIAVRAEAPGMVVGPVYDPKFLGLENAEREVKAVGEVECQVNWSPPTPTGTKPDPNSELTSNCQRVGSGVSVFVGSAGYEGPGGLKEMASFTEAAWKAIAEG
jgi:outer membrane murein-binding lipoprotein Lpp